MNEQRHYQRRDVKWQPVTRQLDFSLVITSFYNLVRTDHHARIVDFSLIGIGIESDHPINPGIVLFRESVYGQKCGVLMWCHQTDNQYLCGIRFLSLTQAEDEFFRYQIERAKSGAQIQDHDRIIAQLNDCFLKS
jgi:PilZ domain